MTLPLSYREALLVQAFRRCSEQRADSLLRLAALVLEREQWERSAQTIAEYDRWYLEKLLAEAGAETFGARP